jgi:ferredoxin-nitrite reductase
MGFSYLGVVVPVGRLASAQLRGLADLVARYGSGIRLTVWQNFLIADVADKEVKALVDGLAAIGLAVETSAVRAGLVACTGNTGCKFAATNTKGQALALADYLDAHVALDLPINIHLTGCPNSCAQHYVGDIGLLGVKVEAGDDMIEAYNVIVGGGAGEERVLGRELWQGVPVAELPARTVSLLQAYLAARQGPSETFHAFAGRMSVDELKQLCGARQA